MRIIGVDIGGTTVKIGVTENGKILEALSVPVDRNGEYGRLLCSIAEPCKILAETYGAERIGMGSPGLIDTNTGKVCFSNNIFMQDVSLKEDMEREAGLPVRIANDAKCATLGEAMYGAGKVHRRVAMLTLGTGVGGGFVVDGTIVGGTLYADAADIFGHMTLVPDGRECNCGRRGCLEAYCSASALSNRAQSAYGREISAKELFELDEKGDYTAKIIIEEFSKYLGIAIVSLANILRPECFVIGGGVSASAKRFLPMVNRMLKKEIFGIGYAPVRAVEAKLGNKAGIIGAATLWNNEV